MNEVHERYKDNPDVVFASIILDKKKDVKAFLEMHSISYLVIANAMEICELLEVTGYPIQCLYLTL